MIAYTPTPEQARALDAFATGDPLVIQAGAGTGKALRHDQPVLTPLGFVPIRSLEPGDPVIGSDGLTYRITGVYPQGIRPLYDIAFSDGTHVIADAEHRWFVQTNKQRDRDQPGSVVTTAQMLASGLKRPMNGARWFVPMAAPVKQPHIDLVLDPWLLGVLLGDGNLAGTPAITNPEQHIIDRVRDLVTPLGVTMKANPSDPITWRLGGAQTKPGIRGFWNPIVSALRQLGLRDLRSHEKFIPAGYLRASIEQRAELMRGLFDTDGSRAGTAAVEYTTTSPQLARNVIYLVQSLGGTATLAEKPTTHKLAYRLYIKLPAGIEPFSLPRKGAGWGTGKRHQPFRAIRSITPVEPDEAVCISVDSPDHLYLTAGHIPTHNTSTLKMLAESAPGRRGLYVAYNRALADEAKAKFPRSVKCATAHSLAYGAVGRLFKHRLNAGRKPAREVALILGINNPLWLGEAYAPVTPVQLARIVNGLIGRFCFSADPQPGIKHLPRITGLEAPEVREAIAQAVRPYVEAAWADLTDPDGRLPYNHDCYLKLWQLSGPVLPTDYVLFDEAQDANPVIADVIGRQEHAQIVAVGDSCQAIYGWRGAENAMDRYGGTRLTLSKSFRFGPAIAAAANEWLDLLAAPLRLTGHEPIASQLAPLARPNAILTRSNAGAMAEVLAALADGRRPALVGGGNDMRRLAEAAVTLKAGAGTDHPELFAFRTWGEVQDYVEMDDSGSDLRVLVKLIDEHGPDRIIAACDALAGNERSADVVISTAHKAKGREWGTVRIGSDFNPPSPDPEDPRGRILVPREEAMLAYVAVTRAQEVLDNVGLAWVKDVHGIKGAAPALRPVPVAAPASLPTPAAPADPAGDSAEIPDGYYAVPDPDDAARMTLWRVAGGLMHPSPAGAKHGPRLLDRDVPPGRGVLDRQEFIRTWHDTVRLPWAQAVRAALAADPEAAGARFAETAVRCRDCGRLLTDEVSKAAGRGPDCREKAGVAS